METSPQKIGLSHWGTGQMDWHHNTACSPVCASHLYSANSCSNLCLVHRAAILNGKQFVSKYLSSTKSVNCKVWAVPMCPWIQTQWKREKASRQCCHGDKSVQKPQPCGVWVSTFGVAFSRTMSHLFAEENRSRMRTPFLPGYVAKVWTYWQILLTEADGLPLCLCEWLFFFFFIINTKLNDSKAWERNWF